MTSEDAPKPTKPAPQPEPRPKSHASARRRPATAPEEGIVARAFAILASPWVAAACLGMLAGLHLFKSINLADPSGIFWVDDSLRAITVAVLASSLLAMATARVLPALQRQPDAPDDALAPDFSIPDDLEREELGLIKGVRSVFIGLACILGAGALCAALVGYALLPLLRSSGLEGRGGELSLVTGQSAESAVVDVGGLKAKQNLGGHRFELVGVDLGRLDEDSPPNDEAPASITLRHTHVVTGESSDIVVAEGQSSLVSLASSENFHLRLIRIAPTAAAGGMTVKVIDAGKEGGADVLCEGDSGKRAFNLDLMQGQARNDPDGPGLFRLDKIEPNLMGQLGLAMSGIVAEDGKAEAPFWIYEKSPNHDALHRQGRYRICYVDLVPGYKAIVSISRRSSGDLAPVLAGLLVLGVVLLFSGTQLSVLRRDGELLVSSLNNAEGAVWAMTPGDDDDGEEA